MKAARFLMFAPLCLGTAAVAQEAPPPTAAPEASAEATAPVSEEEVDRFALAALVVEQIARDEAIDEQKKQTAMKDAVEQAGLAPQRFNQIALASQTDTELQERIQVAAAAHVEAAQQNQ